MRLVCDRRAVANAMPKALKGITLASITIIRSRLRTKHEELELRRVTELYRLESDILTMRYDALEEARAGFKALYEIEIAKNSSR
jgi:hypothetical protein